MNRHTPLAEQLSQTFLNIPVPYLPRHVCPHTLTGVFIDDVQDSECLAVMRTVLHKVISPHMVRVLWAQAIA